jgi:hypothetical protein
MTLYFIVNYIYEKMLEMGYNDKYGFVLSYNGNLEIP